MYEARWHCNFTGILQSYFHVPAKTAVRRSCRPVGCTQSFATDMGRRRHIKTVHQNIKEFACPICGHFVRDNYNLNAHLKSHGTTLSELRPDVAMTCRYCNMRFDTVDERLEHMEEHRKETKPQGWAKLKASYVHKRRKPQEEIGTEGKMQCALCEAKVSPASFTTHLGEHTSSVMKTSEVFLQSVCKFLETLSDADQSSPAK